MGCTHITTVVHGKLLILAMAKRDREANESGRDLGIYQWSLGCQILPVDINTIAQKLETYDWGQCGAITNISA